MARRSLLVLIFGLCLWLPRAALADFQAGVAAYDRGDYREAMAQWLPLAQKEDLAAQRNVAQLYRLGLGTAKNPVQAAYWYKRAAEHGLAAAQVNLAVLYLRGEGVQKDPREAARWLERAARAGHPLAQYNLGMMYESGLGVKRDPARAMGWYYLAARNGESGALKRLGQLVPFSPLNLPPDKAALPEIANRLPAYGGPPVPSAPPPPGMDAVSIPSAPVRSPPPPAGAPPP
jgi:hypothetical protein